jgi:hypothetical protein
VVLAVPGNQPARGLRRRRCPQRVNQAGNCPRAAQAELRLRGYGNHGPFGTIKDISRLRTVSMKRPGEPNGQCYTLWLT